MKKITATFEVSYTQYLDAQGNLIDKDKFGFAENEAKLVQLYRLMVRLRTFDQKAVNLQRTGKIGTYAPTLGQEAIGIAMGYAMQKEDVYCPFYRDYGTMMQRGVPLSKILNYWGGDERGSYFSDTSEDFPICVPIATQCLHAAGIAYAFKYRQEARVAVTSIGDGGTSQGDFYEALNVAGAWTLPLVVVVNNNQWAISVPRKIQTSSHTIAQKGIAAGVHVAQVDGNDVIAMLEVFQEALDRARRGEGATLIEAITYRLCDHTTADDARRYRPDAEVETAWQQEPILRLRNYLAQKKWWDEQKEKALIAECSAEIESVVATYLNTPAPVATDMLEYLYAEVPDALLDQFETLSGMTVDDHH